MPIKLLIIADSQYRDAALAITAFRTERGESGVDDVGIEKVLRSYVYLGQTKAIPDWSYKLAAGDKDDVSSAVAKETDRRYNFLPADYKVFVDLQIMELLASQGQVAPNVARPREWQERYETDSLPTDIDQTGLFNNIDKGIENFFTFARKSIEDMFKGLGLDIPLPLILALAAVAVLAIMNSTRRA